MSKNFPQYVKMTSEADGYSVCLVLENSKKGLYHKPNGNWSVKAIYKNGIMISESIYKDKPFMSGHVLKECSKKEFDEKEFDEKDSGPSSGNYCLCD